MMDKVIGTQAFREGSFNIYHDDAARRIAGKLNLDYSNGEDISKTIHLNTEKYEAFRKAYLLDLQQFSYSFARARRPVGRVVVSYNAERKGSRNPAPEDLEAEAPETEDSETETPGSENQKTEDLDSEDHIRL